MTSANRVQITSIKEVTVGTTPGTPRMRTRRSTGETLKLVPTFEESVEMRADGMNGPPIQNGQDSDGDFNFEFSYPVPNSPQATDIESAFHAAWSDTNSRDNDGTADSILTNVATTNEVLTCTTGVAFVASELYRFSGFGVTGNNGTFKCTTGSATAPRFSGAGLTDEAAPPAAARVKCIGFQGASGDITATASGLASTLLDFTTIPGIGVGKWMKVGGSAAGDKFATAALNPILGAWMRVTAVATHAISCDNLPSGWTTDSGTSKTIKVFFGDQIKNGTTQIGQSFEKGFLGQGTPSYIVQPGLVVNKYSLDLTATQKIAGTVSYTGMTASVPSTTSLDASPDAATSMTNYPVMAGGSNVGRVGEAGAPVAAPNFMKSLKFNIGFKLTTIDALDIIGAAGINSHTLDVSGTHETYFGDLTFLSKYHAGTPTSLNARVAKNSMAVIFSFPQVTYNSDGSPNASAKDSDVMLPLGWKASKEETITNAMALMDRLEYFEL